jgi:spore germination cell wall hydrolase CwlJ-like protein
MLYSQSGSTVNVAKVWKVLIASLSLILAWQYITVQASATDNESNIQHTVIEPEIPQEPTPEELYTKASFLDMVPSGKQIRYTDKDLFCLAKNIYHEARGEPTLGKYAVAQVTMNRVRHPSFSKTICGVVFEPNQFSWANDRSIRWTRPSNASWDESIKIARQVLDHGVTIKGMENALFFHATYVRPGWRNVRRLATIGDHIFYKQV